MAKRKRSTRRGRESEAKRRARRGFSVFVAILLIIAIAGTYILWEKGYIEFEFGDGHGGTIGAPDTPQESVITDELSVHFLMLGNANTGDCTLIKTGDIEILIDAGSKKNSAKTIKSYVDTYCTDGVLEYVIATHAHEDHIAGFVGNKNGASRTGIFYEYEIGTIIQFERTNQSLTTNKGNDTLYGEYCKAVEYAQTTWGTTVYTALDCVNGENGAKATWELADDISFTILDQKYYREKSSTENDYSVCTLLTQGNNHYLFTGDLEEDGEESLVEKNELPKCKLFKAGHHGSPTSSTTSLLAVIEPEIVCVCCCCGNMEYASNPLNDFPSQAFVDRVAPYTDKIYVTTITSENAEKFEPMNGNIVVSSNGGEVSVNCSNNNVIFKDTEWFKANRTWKNAS